MHPDDQHWMTDTKGVEFTPHLLPQPINGNLRRAEVLILMPGARAGDDDVLWATQAHLGERAAMAAAQQGNILQPDGPLDH